MNVLYVAYRVPYPPDKGERIRTYHQIRHLGSRGKLHLVCPVRGHEEEAFAEHLARSECASVHAVPDSRMRSFAREAVTMSLGNPRSRATFGSTALRRAVGRVLESRPVDVLVASTVYAAEPVRRFDHVPRVIDFMDVYSDVWKARGELRSAPWCWTDRIEAKRLARYEAAIAREFDVALFVSSAEARRFADRIGPARAATVGNGVDLDYFVPPPTRPSSRTIVFTGSMDYPLNVDAVVYFCERIFPAVRDRISDARFRIVGRDPAPVVRALAREPGVTVTGPVEDVRPHLASAALAVAPLRHARGVQNKILEALAMGVPVVSTSGGLEGLDAGPCDALIRADDAAAFARRVTELLQDEARADRLGRAGREFVERHYRWEDRGAELDRVLEDVVARRAERLP